jgi:hypothetical protein
MVPGVPDISVRAPSGAVLAAIWFALQDNKEDPSSALRAPSPTRGEGDGADGLEGEND